MIVFELQKFGEIKQYTEQDLSYLQKKMEIASTAIPIFKPSSQTKSYQSEIAQSGKI